MGIACRAVMITLLTGSLGKYVAYAAMAVALAGGAAWALHTHDARVRAEQQVAIDRATTAEITRQHAVTVAALEQTAAEAEMRAGYFENIRTTINAQTVTTACAGSPAIRSLLDGLRRPAGGSPGTASADPGQPANLSH